ncbi:hypothetical protein LINPERPRIM_LOCUS42568 [Linum perenne]
MKRKKWSESEEQTLLSKYNDLQSSGSLSKLKTREKKFRPIADHVNAVHHLQDPAAFPFRWSWRDVSIKVQNMRHQYIGVKQKIRSSNGEFSWKDGENHWENFLRYKEVFGDVEVVESKSKRYFSMLSSTDSSELFRDCGEFGDLGLGFDSEELEEEDELNEGDSCDDDEDRVSGDDCSNAGGEEEEEEEEDRNCEIPTRDNSEKAKKGKLKGVSKRLGLLGAQVVDLKDMVVRREEKRREREFDLENSRFEKKQRSSSSEKEDTSNSKLEKWEMELEERELALEARELRNGCEIEDIEEKRRKMRLMEEKREEEEMEWRERVLRMQIEHEKLIMQIQAEACQNQMQILGVMARLVCQFYGPGNDGLGGGLVGGLGAHQVLQNLQHHHHHHHPGGDELGGDGGKPGSSSPSEFL